MLRPALFTLTGLVWFGWWVAARPSFEGTSAMREWPYVLGFSAALLLLAVAIAAFAQMVGGRGASRFGMLAAGGAVIASFANVLEDGLRLDWAFFIFILATAIIGVALPALAFVIARSRRGGQRALACIPAATAIGIVLYVIAGGPVLLASWLAAAAAALRWGADLHGLRAPITPRL